MGEDGGERGGAIVTDVNTLYSECGYMHTIMRLLWIVRLIK